MNSLQKTQIEIWEKESGEFQDFLREFIDEVSFGPVKPSQKGKREHFHKLKRAMMIAFHYQMEKTKEQREQFLDCSAREQRLNIETASTICGLKTLVSILSHKLKLRTEDLMEAMNQRDALATNLDLELQPTEGGDNENYFNVDDLISQLRGIRKGNLTHSNFSQRGSQD